MIGSIHDGIILEAPEAQAEVAACMPQEIIVVMGCELPHRQSMPLLGLACRPIRLAGEICSFYISGIGSCTRKASKPEGLFIK